MDHILMMLFLSSNFHVHSRHYEWRTVPNYESFLSRALMFVLSGIGPPFLSCECGLSLQLGSILNSLMVMLSCEMMVLWDLKWRLGTFSEVSLPWLSENFNTFYVTIWFPIPSPKTSAKLPGASICIPRPSAKDLWWILN